MYFTTYYHTPKSVINQFGVNFTKCAVEGLSVLTPTAQSERFALKFPRFYHLLVWLDGMVCKRQPWLGWGDFYILTMQYTS